MRTIIPGHAIAFTWILIVVVCGASLWKSGIYQAFGMLLIIIGAFFGDQATHLNQEAHRDPAPTWLEKKMQMNKGLFQIIGLLMAFVGVFIIFTFLLFAVVAFLMLAKVWGVGAAWDLAVDLVQNK